MHNHAPRPDADGEGGAGFHETRFATAMVYLIAFAEKHGHTRVPQKHVVDGFPLGFWVRTRRTEYRTGALSAARAARLAAVPHWTWTTREAHFAEGVRLLRELARQKGNVRVPHGMVVNGFRLHTWANTRRTEYRTGRLSPEHAAILEQVPGWSWDPRGDNFENGIKALLGFVARFGHADVGPGHVENGINLGMWVHTRRLEFRKGCLSRDRINRLEEIDGWTWYAHSSKSGMREGLRQAACRSVHTYSGSGAAPPA